MQIEGLDDKELSRCNANYKARSSNSSSCLLSGITQLYSPYAEVNQKSIKFHPDHPPMVTTRSSPPHAHGKRHLAVTGTRSVVILRVVASDSVVPQSAAELSDYVFSTTKLSLRSGYDACSYGQLLFTPTTHSKAVNGAVDVAININAIGIDSGDIVNAALNVATNMLGDLPSQFDHVMMAMPPGVTNGDGG